MPGDPGGSALSPLPGCALLRRRAAPGLYIGRALAALGVPAVSELLSARAGGGPGRRAALSLLLCPPTPHRGLLLLLLLGGPASQLSVPPRPYARYSSWFEPRCAAPRAPPNPPCSQLHYRTQKKMSTTLLSAFYDIDFLCKVSWPEGKDGGLPGTLGVPRLGCRVGSGGSLPS